MNSIDKTAQFAQASGCYGGPEWERLPEIDLYMDQVIMYLNKQLSPISDAAITSNMVNNYVKDGLVKRPEQKRYAREHLAALFMINGMKSCLQMPDIAYLLTALDRRCTAQDGYEAFLAQQSGALANVMSRVDDACKEASKKGRYYLEDLASALTLEASARRLAAEKIIAFLKEEKGEKDA